MKGLPFLNIGALFLPPIWGAAHGMWATILWYPLWLVADNVMYGAYANPTPLSIALAALVFVGLTAATVAFARVAQPFAAHRAIDSGKTKEQYLKTERAWAVGCVIAGVILIAFATYYNLVIRPTAGV